MRRGLTLSQFRGGASLTYSKNKKKKKDDCLNFLVWEMTNQQALTFQGEILYFVLQYMYLTARVISYFIMVLGPKQVIN